MLVALHPPLLLASPSTEGRLVVRTRELYRTPYASLSAPDRALLSEAEHRAAQGQLRAETACETLRITYLSRGLRIRGWVCRPSRAPHPLPVILYLRGGNRDVGAVGVGDFQVIHALARRGFAVVATNYRGAPGGEGRDEFGGADLDDVLSLRPLLRALPGCDAGRLFLLGFSRGGMMAFRALGAGLPVRAAATWGAPTDLRLLARARPDMERQVFRELIPGYVQDPEGTLALRSAICWPERLGAPLLLIHGGADRRVPVAQTEALAASLQRLGRPCETLIFEGDDHALSRHRDEALQRIVEWFRSHLGNQDSEGSPSRSNAAPKSSRSGSQRGASGS